MYEQTSIPFVLVDDTIIRLDEVQSVEPSPMGPQNSIVYFRNGKNVPLSISRKEAWKVIFNQGK